MSALDAAELLAAYDAQLRALIPDPLPAGEQVERDGPVLRFSGGVGHGWVLYRDLGGLDGAELDELIARQVRVFAARGERFEWKLHGHDRPADLPERLRAAGFEPEDLETVVIAPVAAVAGPPSLPNGVALREVTERHDLERIGAMEEEVWQQEQSRLPEMIEAERAADPDSIAVVVAEAGEAVVCAAWIRFALGTEFATLWGGATLPEWRRRGVYRATVAYRANLAAERGLRYLEVDASSDSAPILQRLGFVAVTTTTPYVWSPPSGDSVRPSLFEFAGGEAVFLALARAHHARCLADPVLNHVFSHPDQHPQHVERLAAYWAEVLGGPPTYSAECGDESELLQLHVCNEEITELGERFLDCFAAALDEAGLPDDAEFRAAMRAYMRWAVDNVLVYSDGRTPVPAGAAIPRWGWNGLE